jgi:hypothetical protein
LKTHHAIAPGAGGMIGLPSLHRAGFHRLWWRGVEARGWPRGGREVLRFAFEELRLPEVVSFTVPENLDRGG